MKVKYKVKTFTGAQVIGQDMEVYLNTATQQGWQLFQSVDLNGWLVVILQREDNE